MSEKGMQNPFNFGKDLQVIKPVIPEDNLEKTSQFTNILKKCDVPEDYQRYFLYHCKSANQQWVEAYTKLTDDDPDVPWKTVKKGIISDVFELTDSEKRKNFVEREFGNKKIELFEGRYKTVYELYFQDKTKEQFSSTAVTIGRLASSRDDVLGSFTRNTVNFWFEGSMPQDRDVVIKLAFWAKCTVEETNKLLELAGMHKLYLKGTGNIKSTRSSLQDIVYIFMLQKQDYSYSTAQDIIKSLSNEFNKKVAEKITIDPKGTSTTDLQKIFNEVNSSSEKLNNYFKENISKLLYSYTTLYGNIVEIFAEKYAISKGNQADPIFNSIRALTVSQLELKTKQMLKEEELKSGKVLNKKKKKYLIDGVWKESLKKTLYSAFNADDKTPKSFNEKYMVRVFQRNDIIILGIISNSSKDKINDLLQYAHEAPLYTKNFAEAVIYKATSDPTIYCPSSKVIDLLFTATHYRQYGITKKELSEAVRSYLHFYAYPSFYENEMTDLSAGITAMLSLRKFEWIKSVSVVKEIFPQKEREIVHFQYITKDIIEKDKPEYYRSPGSTFVIKYQFRHAVRKKKELLKRREQHIREKKQELNAEEILLKTAVRKGEEERIKYLQKRIEQLKASIESIDLNPAHIPEPSKITTKTLYLAKLQVVRPIAYRYCKELLSYYPEKTLFDFLVEKTSSYLRDEQLCKYFKKGE